MNTSANLWKNFRWLYQGLWGRWFIEKFWSKTLSCTVLFKYSLPVRRDEYLLLSGSWWKMIHDKIMKQKISWHCPFKNIIFQYAQMGICNCPFNAEMAGGVSQEALWSALLWALSVSVSQTQEVCGKPSSVFFVCKNVKLLVHLNSIGAI